MAKFRNFEEGQKEWQNRANKAKSEYQIAFKSSMQDSLRESKNAMDRHNIPRGELSRSEKITFLGSFEAYMTNTAQSLWKGTKTFYGWFVALGVRARSKGQRYYAWMKNPRQARPTTWREWLDAREQGRAVLTHDLRAIPPRNWRETAINNIRRRKLFEQKLKNATNRAIK